MIPNKKGQPIFTKSKLKSLKIIQLILMKSQQRINQISISETFFKLRLIKKKRIKLIQVVDRVKMRLMTQAFQKIITLKIKICHSCTYQVKNTGLFSIKRMIQTHNQKIKIQAFNKIKQYRRRYEQNLNLITQKLQNIEARIAKNYFFRKLSINQHKIFMKNIKLKNYCKILLKIQYQTLRNAFERISVYSSQTSLNFLKKTKKQNDQIQKSKTSILNEQKKTFKNITLELMKKLQLYFMINLLLKFALYICIYLFQKNHISTQKSKGLKAQLYQYKTRNVKAIRLARIEKQLKLIPCHSVANQRSFSVLKRIFNENKGKITDKNICHLHFLNYYYNSSDSNNKQ